MTQAQLKQVRRQAAARARQVLAEKRAQQRERMDLMLSRDDVQYLYDVLEENGTTRAGGIRREIVRQIMLRD